MLACLNPFCKTFISNAKYVGHTFPTLLKASVLTLNSNICSIASWHMENCHFKIKFNISIAELFPIISLLILLVTCSNLNQIHSNLSSKYKLSLESQTCCTRPLKRDKNHIICNIKIFFFADVVFFQQA